MDCSVIICTHNPRSNYLHRVLEALRAQTMPREQWELLLIDNASKEPLGSKWDLTWHPHSRHFRENKIGLTSARLRGINESVADILIFVDDDNVLDSNYLSVATEIAIEHKKLGAWGGQVIAEFEVLPKEQIRPFLQFLCVRELERDFWGNSTEMLPHGAGMCIRREVANLYRHNTMNNSRRLSLGRCGNFLGGGEDLEMALTSHDLDLGTGLFQALLLKHLIPAKRLQETYILKLLEDGAASGVILESLRPRRKSTVPSRIDLWVQRYKYWRANPLQKKAANASRRGEAIGKAMLANLAGGVF